MNVPTLNQEILLSKSNLLQNNESIGESLGFPLKVKLPFLKQASNVDESHGYVIKKMLKSKEHGDSTADASDNNPYDNKRYLKKKSIRSQNSIRLKANSELEDTHRLDFFGNKIYRNGKNHRIVFKDNVNAGLIEEVIEISKLEPHISINPQGSSQNMNETSKVKQIVVLGESSKDVVIPKPSAINSKVEDDSSFRNDNCSCACVIY